MSSDEVLSDFECLCCGGCCAINGFVCVSANELQEIARRLGLSVADAHERYTVKRLIAGHEAVVLRDHLGTTRCIFLNDENRCIVHPVKPRQCREFPVGWKDGSSHTHCAALQRLRANEVGTCRRE